MSVTEATRVIAYRERKDGFESVDGLDRVPGIPKKLLDEIKDQLTAWTELRLLREPGPEAG